MAYVCYLYSRYNINLVSSILVLGLGLRLVNEYSLNQFDSPSPCSIVDVQQICWLKRTMYTSMQFKASVICTMYIRAYKTYETF